MDSNEVVAGICLPELRKSPNEASIFFYSAATWNGHRIHYDREYARSEGHKDMVLQGTLQGNWLIELVQSWVGLRGRVVRLKYRNVRTAYVNQDFVVRGTISKVSQPSVDGGRKMVEFEVTIEGPDGVTTTGVIVAELS
jgi:acyl dehydratase